MDELYFKTSIYMTDIYENRDSYNPDVESFLEQDKLKDLPFIGKYLEKKQRVSVIRFSGIIADDGRRKSGISYHKYHEIIDKAFERAQVAVALVINSPGGSPAQCELIGNHIRRLAHEKEIPVIAFVEDVAASGGYWLACSANAIYAQNTSIVGSIGVISAGFGFEEMIGKWGMKRRVYTSGKDKSFLDSFAPEKERDVTRLKDLQKDIHATFIDWVKERRGSRIHADDEDIFEGAFWTAGQALDYGLIDGIGNVYSYMNESFGKKVKFVEFAPDKRFLSRLPFVSAQAGTGIDISASAVIDALETENHWNRFGL
jgi:serine protease SohB